VREQNVGAASGVCVTAAVGPEDKTKTCAPRKWSVGQPQVALVMARAFCKSTRERAATSPRGSAVCKQVNKHGAFVRLVDLKTKEQDCKIGHGLSPRIDGTHKLQLGVKAQ
jgi:hypothetical protein